MRAIKFRGKRPDGVWVEGAYCNIDEFFNEKYPEARRIVDEYGVWHRVTPGSVGQFTGAYDMNNKRIWEGDIVKVFGIKSYVGTVIWDTKWMQYYCRNKKMQIDIALVNRWSEQTYEVIGNIHDNPELLKEEV